MRNVLKGRGGRGLLAFAAVTALAAIASAGATGSRGVDQLSKINHIVVIYEENHSFDNLYGGWEGVNGRAAAQPDHTLQINEAGNRYHCLLQNDVNLTSPPLPSDCADATSGSPAFVSHFPNEPFSIEAYIPNTATTCPTPQQSLMFISNLRDGTGQPGGCTRDLVHRFYQEQYQLDNGMQDRYTTGSDAVGLTQGYYDTTALPIYQYLHSEEHPHYAIADDFFQAAFGGSFLNHQWLIAAATPTDNNPNHASQHSIIDSNGMPNTYLLYAPTGPVLDRSLTQVCPSAVPGRACGDFAVNTIQPPYQPTSSNPVKLPPQTEATIGDELTESNVSWAWYSGGWSNADGDVGAPGWTNGNGTTCSDPDSFPNPAWPYCPNKVFQFHHQPFNYFKTFATVKDDGVTPDPDGLANRAAHLRDEQEFISKVNDSGSTCQLNSVSFVKPIGLENEHPGYTSESRGSDHLVSLLQAIEGSACAEDTTVIVTYDEFGGQWDHVSPPGQGSAAVPGRADQWGPGTRIPALIVSPFLRGNFVVDHTEYDTTSILKTIEDRFGVKALSSRDTAVNSLSNVFEAKQYEVEK